MKINRKSSHIISGLFFAHTQFSMAHWTCKLDLCIIELTKLLPRYLNTISTNSVPTIGLIALPDFPAILAHRTMLCRNDSHALDPL